MPDRRAQLEEKIRAFQEQAAKAGQLKDKISELRGQARSGDGSVIATVAPSGAVLGLQLSPNAMKYSHTQLQQVAVVYPTHLFEAKPATVFTTFAEIPRSAVRSLETPYVGASLPARPVVRLTFADGSSLDLRDPRQS